MKTVLITGASVGIGKETILMFQNKVRNIAATMKIPVQLSIRKVTKHRF
jgi:NADP-dependent 3-hydroxy acid dehydrogenase YdfG